MMGRLIEDYPSPARCLQFFRPAWTVEKVGEIHSGDRAQIAELAAGNQLTGALDGQVETVAVSDDHLDARPARFVDHGAAFVERERHRFFHQNMFTVTRCDYDVFGMELMRRRDIDRLDVIVRTQLFDAAICAGRKIRCEPRTRFRARIGRRQQSDFRVLHKARGHQQEGAAQSRYAQSQRAISHHVPVLPTLAASSAPRDQFTGFVPHAGVLVSRRTANVPTIDADSRNRHRIKQSHQRNAGERPREQRCDERHPAAKHAIADMIGKRE